MKVLEKSRDRLVLKTSRQKWFLGGFAATFDIVLLTISLATDWLAGSDLDVLMRGLFIFLGAYCVLYGLHTLVVSKTVTADRWRQAVGIETLRFGLWRHSSKVSFNQVQNVELTHKHREGMGATPSTHDT